MAFTSTSTRGTLRLASAQFAVSNRALASGLATITTAAHTFRPGDIINVAGLGAPFDGKWVVNSVPSATTLTYYVQQVPVYVTDTWDYHTPQGKTWKLQYPTDIASGAGTGTVTGERSFALPSGQVVTQGAAAVDTELDPFQWDLIPASYFSAVGNGQGALFVDATA